MGLATLWVYYRYVCYAAYEAPHFGLEETQIMSVNSTGFTELLLCTRHCSRNLGSIGAQKQSRICVLMSGKMDNKKKHNK